MEEEALIRGTGWRRQALDHRDHKYSFHPTEADVSGVDFDLRPHMPPVVDQGQSNSCHDDKTEVLTDRGWRFFADLDGSERMATVDPKTARMIYEAPTRIFRFPYKGKMLCVRNQSLDFKVTPNHKMLVRKWNEAKRTLSADFEFVNARDMGWYVGLLGRIDWQGESSSDIYTLPGVEHNHCPQRNDRDVPMRDWLRFLGFYLADGTMVNLEAKQYRIQLAAKKGRKKEFVKNVLSALELHWTEYEDRFCIHNKQIYEELRKFGFLGKTASQKSVPPFVFRQTPDNINAFIEGCLAGDGCIGKTGQKTYFTVSTQLADDIQRLIFLSGNQSTIFIRDNTSEAQINGRPIYANFPLHAVSIRRRENPSIERKKLLFEEDYDGEVFCAEVPTFHTLITRRNGKILISGNCVACAVASVMQYLHKPAPGVEPYPFSRLFIYWCGREIEGETTLDNGLEIRDGIKAVAKFGAPPEDMWPFRRTLVKKRPINRAYDAAKKDLLLKYEVVPQRASSILSCLKNGFPVIFGMSIFAGIESTETLRTGYIQAPHDSERPIGAHALVIVGYQAASKRFVLRNSWSELLGDAGYFYVDAAYVLDPDLADDFWVCSLVQ